MSVPENPEAVLERDPIPIKSVLGELIMDVLSLVFILAVITHEMTPIIPAVVDTHADTVMLLGVMFFSLSALSSAHRKIDDTTKTALAVQATIAVCVFIQITQLLRILFLDAALSNMYTFPATFAVVFVLSVGYVSRKYESDWYG